MIRSKVQTQSQLPWSQYHIVSFGSFTQSWKSLKIEKLISPSIGPKFKNYEKTISEKGKSWVVALGGSVVKGKLFQINLSQPLALPNYQQKH